MVRKERKKEPKKDKSKAEKKPVAVKKSRLPKAAKVEKTESAPVAEMPSMPPIIEILSDARLGICFFNKNDEVEYVNRHFTEITGLPLEKLAGKKLRKNVLWGSRGHEDEFQELFIEARESGKNLVREHLSVGPEKEDQRYWTLNLLPQSEGKSEYSGMYLVIEELSDIRPSTSMMELINGFQQAALHHSDEQSLLDDLAGILKDFSRCSYIKMAVVNKTGDGVVKAETGKEQGLWDVDQTLSADSINKIFEMNGEESPSYRTNRGSIYLEDISQIEDSLKGSLQELVVDLRNSYGFRSLAFVPVKTDSNITGLIQLANKKAGGIPEEVLDSVETISDQLKVILDRMELQDEVRRQRESLLRQMHERSAHLEALSERLKQEISERKKRQDEMRVQRDLAVKLSGIVNMDEALKLCLDTAIEVAGADSGGIYIVDKNTGVLKLHCSKGLTEEFIGGVNQYETSSSFYELVAGIKPEYTTLDNLEQWIGDSYKKEGLKAAALIPIVYHDKAIGCLNIASHVYDEIPENTRNALETVSAQIGSVITRIQDRKELEDTVERYSTLFERSANPILILDSDGKYLDGNGAALAFLECTREELKAMHVRDTLPPYLDENWFQQYRNSWEKGGKVERDYYVWGKIKVMELVITSLPLEKDRIVICVGTDITERKRIEAALQKSEEKYRTHVNSVTDVIFSVDVEETITDISPSVYRLLGYKPEELIGHHFSDLNLLAPESLQTAHDNLKTVLSGANVENSEYQFIAKDGTRKYAEINGAPLYSGDKIIGTVSVARDITERTRAQEALHKSEEQYRFLAENIMDVIYLLDMDFHITWITPSGEKISGYTAEEMKTMPFDKLITQTSIEAVREFLSPAVKEAKEGKGEPGRVYQIELEVYRKDGSTYWTDNAFQFIRDENGIAHTIFAVGRDVTDHKKMEEALVESECRYRSLVESSGAGIATVNMAGQINFVNDALCRMTGYTREEVLVKQFKDFVHYDDMENTQKLFTEAVEGSTPHEHVRFRLVCKDGREAWFHTSPTEMIINGETVGFCVILQEITERRKAEEALRQSEEKFRDLADLLPQVVFEADTEGILTYVNKSGYEVFGYGLDELVGKMKVADFLIPKEREMVMKNYFSILGGEKSAGNEYTALQKDGSVFSALVFSNTIVHDGKAVGLRGTFTDISGIKKVEKALRESEEKYRSLIENAGEAIFLTQDSAIKFANQRSFQIVQYSKEEIFSRPLDEIVHPEDRVMVVQRYAKRLQGESEVRIYDFRIIDKDGSIKWLELRATTIQWEGRPATLNFVTDVTQNKRAEEALKESEGRYRLLAENSLDVIWTANMQGEITYISPSVRYVVGRSSDEIMSMYRSGTLTTEAFGVTEEDKDRFINGLQTLTKDPSRTLSYEFVLKHPDGFTSSVEVKMSIMRDQSGQSAGILGVVRDITQQKKMIERLVSSDRLASLGEMAGGLAHEVNNPLTAVMGFAYLLQQNPDTPPEMKKDIDAIYREGKRAAEVIKSFLVFARGQKSEKQSVYINDILEGVLRLRQSQMAKENVEVVKELEDDMPAVQGDITQLQQAFLNIILNAEYFMYKSNKGGHLTLKSMLQDNKIRILISDDGPGIPADKVNRVFDPFYTTKGVGEGTGMGLSICHGIIRGHGGEINVDSSEGKGSTFIIDLPVRAVIENSSRD